MVTLHETHYPLIITRQGVVPALRDLCACYHATTPTVSAPPQDLRDRVGWIAWTQAHFIRPSHLDHQDLKHLPKHVHHTDFMPYFEALGLIRAVYPPHDAYDVVAIHGGTPWDTWERMTHLIAQIKAGLNVKKIFYINGERLLRESEYQDNCYVFPAFLKDECGPVQLPNQRPLRQNDMALFFWQALTKTLPKAPSLEFVTLSAAGGHIATSTTRFNTVDTVRAILSGYGGEYSSFLFVSNAPYGPYQDASVRLVMRERKLDDVVVASTSPALMHEVTTLPYLDTIARRLYTEDMIQRYPVSPH